MRQIKTLARVYAQILKSVPLSGSVAIVQQIVQGMMPAVSTLILGALCNEIYLINDKPNIQSSLISAVLIYIGVNALARLMDFISSIVVNMRIFEKCNSIFRMQIMQKSANLPLITYEDSDVLNKKERAVKCIDREVLGQVYINGGEFIVNIIALISLISIVLSYSWWLAVCALISVIPFFISRILRGKEFYDMQYIRAEKSRMLTYVMSIFQDSAAAKEMRVMDYCDFMKNKWRSINSEVLDEETRLKDKDNLVFSVCELLKTIGYCASIAVAILLCIRGEITVGALGACMLAFKSLQDGTVRFFMSSASLPENLSYATDYFDYIDLPDEENGIKSIGAHNADISMKNITFTYPNQIEPALDDVSLTIRSKEKVVLLGVNGSGKSTICKLLVGTYRADDGMVKYGETDIVDLDRKSLYRKVAIVPQEFTQFHLTVRENVALADISRRNDDISIGMALDKAGLRIGEAEYNSILGREFDGYELSGGQWQRLLISRAMFKSSDILILDEPTSALDPNTEYDILNDFLKMAKDKTAVIVSHRVGLCKLVDRVVLLDKGRIIANGSHEELMRSSTDYRDFYEAQAKWYKD